MNSKQGILRLIPTDQIATVGNQVLCTYDEQGNIVSKVRPIIITDDAPTEVGEMVYEPWGNWIKVVGDHNDDNTRDLNDIKVKSWGFKKILVMNSQIPQNIIDAIVEGKLKDGDNVSVSTFTWGENENHTTGESTYIQEGKAIVSYQFKNEYLKKAIEHITVEEREETIKELNTIIEQSTSDIEEAFADFMFHNVTLRKDTYENLLNLWKAAIEWRDKNPKNK